jgi:subtilisin-like proprotein convertase family protein
MDPNADPNPKGPISMTAEAFGVTPPIREMEEFRKGPKPPKEIKIQEEENNEVEVDRIIPEAWSEDWKVTDPLAALSRESAQKPRQEVMPGPSLTFDGILNNDVLTTFGSASMPPDTVGDVGPNHYVQSTNFGLFRVFNKTTGAPIGAMMRISTTLFSGLPADNKCRLQDNGDVIVNYDPLADRWLISQFAIRDNGGDTGNPFYQCIAVSQTGDPTGSYFAYAFRAPNINFPDYPHWGVWTDGYYLATHEFNEAGTAYVQGGFFAFNRDKMLVGDPTANFIYFSIAASFGHLPADIDGYMPPAAGTPEMFFRYTADEFGGTDSIISYEFIPNYTTPASSTFTTKPDLAVAAFDPRNPSGRLDIEQPSPATSSHNLDALGTNMMFRVGYRNLGTVASPTNSYVMNFTVNVSGSTPSSASLYQAAIRWEELRRDGAGNMSVFDQGTHAPDPVSGTGRNRWMGSIAQDNNGNLALGFSRSGPGATEFPDIVWAGRTGGIAAAGTMNEGEATMFASTGSQSATNSRWGDYSNMTVDPVDDCTFWYTQEWRDSAFNGTASNNPFKWSTRIGKFKFPSCTNAPKGTISLNLTSCSSGAPINGATVTVNPGSFFRRTNASGNLVSNIDLAPGTYTLVATKNGISSAPQMVVVSNGVTTPVSACIAGPVLESTTATIISESCTPANGAVDPGETVTVSLPVQNVVAPNTSNLKGTLQRTGGAIGVSSPQTYGVVTAGGAAVSQNFTFVADPNLNCGSTVTLSLALMDGTTNLGTVTYSLPANTSTTGSVTTVNYSGAATAVPDNNPSGVNTTIAVSGFTGNIADLNFRINGTSATTGSSGVDHSWVGDLVFKLTSPQGTTVTVINRIDSGGINGNCSNDNFFNTVLDDEAAGGVIVDNNCTAGMTGNFRPAMPLSLFDGENPNGTWTLNVADLVTTDTGTIRAYGLEITPFSCCSSQRRWTGATSTDWNTASNWNPSGVPTASETAIIPSTGVTNEPNISAADVSISGIIMASNRTLTVTSPRTLTVTNSSVINGTVNVTGGVTLNTFADLNNSTFNYNGATAQTLPNVSYNNLTINNAAGTLLSGNATVDGTLTLTNGVLDTGANTLTVSCTGTASGGSTTSYIKGNLKKDYCSTGSFAFPVGTNTNGNEFSPMTANVTVLTTNPSSLTVVANYGTAPATPALDDLITLDRFWTLTETGELTANLTFNYLQSDVDGNESNYRLYRIATGGGSAPTVFPNVSPCPGAGSPCVDTVANTMFIGGVSNFSNWTAGGLAPTGSHAIVSGRVFNAWGGIIRNAVIELTMPGDPTPRIAITNMFGYYRFTDIPVGDNYILTVRAKGFVFNQPSLLLNVTGDMNDVDFMASP